MATIDDARAKKLNLEQLQTQMLIKLREPRCDRLLAQGTDEHTATLAMLVLLIDAIKMVEAE